MATHNSTAEARARAAARRRVRRQAQRILDKQLRAKKKAMAVAEGLKVGAKFCPRCKETKPYDEFQVTRSHWTGRASYCRPCQKERYAAYRMRDVEHARALERKRAKRSTRKGEEGIKRRIKERNAKRQMDPIYCLSDRVRKAVRRQLKTNGLSKRARTFDLLDFTREQLVTHIERQFVAGMGWHNKHKWHIDHIIPLSTFAIQSDSCREFKRAWALTNLRPSWSADNHSKGAKRLFLI